MARLFAGLLGSPRVRRPFGTRLLLEKLEDRCTPSTLVVNSIADNMTPDNELTLREAIAIVNAGNLSGAGHVLTAAESGQIRGTLGAHVTIAFGGPIFADATPDTITLVSGELAITGEVTILGTGADILSISGNNASRVFNITSATATITGMTISNGDVRDAGGGILNNGTLTLTKCTVTDNKAAGDGGGILNNGTMHVANSIVSGNTAGHWGGGILNYGRLWQAINGTLTLTNSILRGNTAGGAGGGIFNSHLATVALRNSTVSGNTAGDGGGGILNDSAGTVTLLNCTVSGNTAGHWGGGIFNEETATTLTLLNCTISGNTAGVAGGGLFNNCDGTGTLTLSNCTITGNAALEGGGIINSNPSCNDSTDSALRRKIALRLKNTIVALNTGGDIAGPATDLGANLIGTSAAQLKLGPLADNGGPTQTHALLPGSVAIDAGTGTDAFGNPVGTDQRGVSRPQGRSSDIGAVEGNSAPLLVDKVAVRQDNDLSITIADGGTTAIPGTSVSYTIVVQNTGPTTATGANVTDAIPALLTNVTYTAIGAGGAAGFTANGTGAIYDTVTLPAGASITYTITGTVPASASGTLTCSAHVSIPDGFLDSNPGNESATDTDVLIPHADLHITKTDGVTTVVPGTTVTYTIVVSNTGPSDAVGVWVQDIVPADLIDVTWWFIANPCGWGHGIGPLSFVHRGNIVDDTIDLPSGASLTYTVTGTLSYFAKNSLANTATVTAPAVVDLSPEDNAATDIDRVLSPMKTAILQEDTCHPGKLSLFINGTDGNDIIRVTPAGKTPNTFTVKINGINMGVFTGVTGRIVVFGYGGNDNIQVNPSIKKDAYLDGGAGNDWLAGGAGNDILLGGEGNDCLFGRAGRDLLIGGLGADRLFAGGPSTRRDADVLIGGMTTLDANHAALCQTLDQWANKQPLTGLTAANVIGDGMLDTLHARKNLDRWFAEFGREVAWIQPPVAAGSDLRQARRK